MECVFRITKVMNLGLVGGINPEVSSSAKAEAGNSM
jgi:hypothetical protein